MSAFVPFVRPSIGAPARARFPSCDRDLNSSESEYEPLSYWHETQAAETLASVSNNVFTWDGPMQVQVKVTLPGAVPPPGTVVQPVVEGQLVASRIDTLRAQSKKRKKIGAKVAKETEKTKLVTTIIGAAYTKKGVKQKFPKHEAQWLVEKLSLGDVKMRKTRSQHARAPDKMYKLLNKTSTRTGWY